MDWTSVLGWLGSVLFLARLVPQPVRIWRTGLSHGVSAQSALNAAVSDTAWLLYGLAAGLPPVWACCLVAVPLDVWTVVLLREKLARRNAITVVVWGLVMLGAWLVAGTDGLGAVLGLSVLVNCAPQVWAAVRGRRLEGIAPATWYFALADASLWGGYGVVVRSPGLIAYGVILLVSSIVVLFRLWQVGGGRRLRPDLTTGLPDPVEPL